MSRLEEWAEQGNEWLFYELGDMVTFISSNGQKTFPVSAILSPSIFTKEMVDVGDGVALYKYERRRCRVSPNEVNPQMFCSVQVDDVVYTIDNEITEADPTLVTLELVRRTLLREQKGDIRK